MKPRLLIADDHPAVREALARLLQPDFDVCGSVANGEAALEAALQLGPDLVILDVAMPILDGPEVAKRLKGQGCRSKIVFLSVSTDPGQVAACLAAGGDAYVWKARMGTELIASIKAVLAGET